MAVDWGFAGQIAASGFGIVFAVLAILTVTIWLLGLGFSKTNVSKSKPDNKEQKSQ